MRITTNAILRNYKSNLGASMSNLDIARTQVMTQRRFNSTMEDPSSALRAAVLNRKYARNEDYLNQVKDVQSYQDAQEDGAMQISNIALTLNKQYGLEALNGTNGSRDTRLTYATAWRDAQESMVLSLNASYEGKYVFAGSDGVTPPFRLADVPKDPADPNGEKKQVLLYRNVDVTTGALYTADNQIDQTANNTETARKERLKNLANDTSYVDLGFGLSIGENTDGTGNTIGGVAIEDSSAFNISLPGIKLVGYDETAGGDNKKNMILLMGEISNKLAAEEFDYEGYRELLGTFDGQRNNVLQHVTTLGTKTEFLTTTKERLETNEINLTTQIDNVVNIDMAEAIMNFSWAQYAYNAALKVGNNILTPSFIDFMN
ncbi:hypothetical protein [Sporofaciens sp. JLR.KK001]|uniref:flagellin N-terminal helical domain-containing protein n=1 Tax=Sporofaciens sp. JLR.KK001 TaxID=3112621 RepID=UPI002FF30A27